jgi:DNA-directed RNA polymerase subunit RPC12/RpoP
MKLIHFKAIFLVLTLSFTPLIALFAENTVKTAIVTANRLNVRSMPSTSGSVIGIVEQNDREQVLQVQGDWTKINFNGKEGWVASKYLTIKQLDESPDSNADYPSTTIGKIIWNLTHLKGSVIKTILFVFAVLVIIVLIIIKVWRKNVCPKCGRARALEFINEETSNLRRVTKHWKEPEKEIDEERMNKRNAELGYNNPRKEYKIVGYKDMEKTVTQYHYRDTYKCKYCGHIVIDEGTREE